jgi:hypothetical protein
MKKKKIKLGFLNLSIDYKKHLQIYKLTFAARTHLAVGQWLEEEVNVGKFRMFRVGTRKTTASRTEGAEFSASKKNLLKTWHHCDVA